MADSHDRDGVTVVRALTAVADGLRPGPGLDHLLALAPALAGRGTVDTC
jgi:hypothetical protein